jgi:hypothetical protein
MNAILATIEIHVPTDPNTVYVAALSNDGTISRKLKGEDNYTNWKKVSRNMFAAVGKDTAKAKAAIAWIAYREGFMPMEGI